MPSTDVEKIKERLGIADVVGSYIKLEKAGSSFKARCPFHNEKTPSFFISPTRNAYHCFGCEAGGDIFTFVEQFEGLDFSGALRVLSLKAGVSLSHENRKERDSRSQLYNLLEEATLYFEQELSKNKDAVKYLSSRGLADKTVASFRIGYAPHGWSNLFGHLSGKGYSEKEIEQAGLIKKGERGNYDRFRSRIMFPIADSSGRIIAFSGRIFGNQGNSSPEPAKYINSPETALFSKSNVLYGFDRAKLGIHRLNCSIIVEGQMDLLMSHQAGFINTVALSGTAFSPAHLTTLKRLSGNIVMAYDADSAGVTSSGRGAHLALALGMDVKVAALPAGVDPADLIEKSTDTWRKVIKNAKHVIDFYLDYLRERGLDQRAFKLTVHEVVLPYVARVQNKIDQAHFVKRVAAQLGVPEDSVWEELSKVKIDDHTIESKTVQKKQVIPAMTRRHSLEQKLFGILLWQEDLDRPLIDATSLRSRFTKIVGKEQVSSLANSTRSHEASLAAELEHSEYAELEESVEELLLHLEEECIKEVFSTTMGELKQAEHDNKEEEMARLLSECKGLSDRIEALNNKKYSINA